MGTNITLNCILCNSGILYTKVNQEEFNTHLASDHCVVDNVDFVLAGCLMNREERLRVTAYIKEAKLDVLEEHIQTNNENGEESKSPNWENENITNRKEHSEQNNETDQILNKYKNLIEAVIDSNPIVENEMTEEDLEYEETDTVEEYSVEEYVKPKEEPEDAGANDMNTFPGPRHNRKSSSRVWLHFESVISNGQKFGRCKYENCNRKGSRGAASGGLEDNLYSCKNDNTSGMWRHLKLYHPDTATIEDDIKAKKEDNALEDKTSKPSKEHGASKEEAIVVKLEETSAEDNVIKAENKEPSIKEMSEMLWSQTQSETLEIGAKEEGEMKTRKCAHCNEGFIKKQSLHLHIKAKHKGSLKTGEKQSLDPTSDLEQVNLFENQELMKRATNPDWLNFIKQKTNTNEVSNDLELKTESTGQKFECQECNRKFSIKQLLRRHIGAKHTGVTFDCDGCDYKATQVSNLKRHTNNVHSNEKKTCTLCPFQTRLISDLIKHRKSNH